MNGGRAIPTILLAVLATAVHAADETFRVEQLRQELAELRRVVREQSRQLERLERELARLASPAPSKGGRRDQDAPGADDLRWVSAAAWQKVSMGMDEAEVLALLGPPTAVRATGADSKTLFYTLELTGTGFLSGSVRLDGGRVREITRPELR